MIKDVLKELKNIFILVFWWMDFARFIKMAEKFFSVWGFICAAYEIEDIALSTTIIKDILRNYFIYKMKKDSYI